MNDDLRIALGCGGLVAAMLTMIAAVLIAAMMAGPVAP